MHDFHEVIESNLADRIFVGDIPESEEVKNLSNQTIVGTLQMVAAKPVEPKNVSSFLGVIEESERLPSVVNSIFGKDDNFAKNASSLAFSGAVAAFDPTGLNGVQFAANLTSILARAAADGVEDPMLKEFLELVADAGQMAAVVAQIAEMTSGVAVLKAAGQALVEEIGGDLLDADEESLENDDSVKLLAEFDSALDEETKNKIDQMSDEQMQDDLEELSFLESQDLSQEKEEGRSI